MNTAHPAARKIFIFRTSLIDNSLCLIPESHPDTAILFQTSEGIFSDHTPMFDIDMQLQTEVDLETDGLDCHYCPHEVTVFSSSEKPQTDFRALFRDRCR